MNARIVFRSGQVCHWHPVTGFVLGEKPVYIVGANYAPRYVKGCFPENWRPQSIIKDLDSMAADGLNAIRAPVYWEYFEPAPGNFRCEALERLEALVIMAKERGLFVMPWFLVGVAIGEYNEISWRNGRSFFDEPMITSAANHLRTLVKALRGHPNILCWDICDEPEWYSRHPGADRLPYATDRFHAWVDRMYRAIKEVDPDRAVTLGFGHIATSNYGMDICRAARTLDAMAVTAYAPHGDEDMVHGFRSGYFLGWSLRFNDCMRKGVFACEAPGWSDIDASQENIGHYYRVALMSSLANGSRGVLPWVWADFDDIVETMTPADKYALEKRFGITNDNGTPKPAREELRKFAQFVAEYPPAEWLPAMPEVGVLAPALNPQAVHAEFALVYHHYMFLRQAGLRVRYVWAEDLDDFDGQLLLLPDSGGVPLSTESWIRIGAWVRKGGCFASTSRHLASVFNSLFGVSVEGRFQALEDVVLGGGRREFSACDGAVLPRGGRYTLVRPEEAEVLIADSRGRPLAVKHASGKGCAIFMAYSPEFALTGIPAEELAAHKLSRFFGGVASLAGLGAPVSCGDPRIELDARRHKDGRMLVIMINHSRFPVTAALKFRSMDGEQVIELPGNGVDWKIKGGIAC